MKNVTIKKLREQPDFISNESYEIRELIVMKEGSTAHCIVYPGCMSNLLQNEFDELWFEDTNHNNLFINNIYLNI